MGINLNNSTVIRWMRRPRKREVAKYVAKRTCSVLAFFAYSLRGFAVSAIFGSDERTFVYSVVADSRRLLAGGFFVVVLHFVDVSQVFYNRSSELPRDQRAREQNDDRD